MSANLKESEVYDALTILFQDIFMRDDIVLTGATNAKSIKGWDSFKQIEIILSIEEKFHMKFTTREVDNLASVGDLVRLIVSRTN